MSRSWIKDLTEANLEVLYLVCGGKEQCISYIRYRENIKHIVSLLILTATYESRHYYNFIL